MEKFLKKSLLFVILLAGVSTLIMFVASQNSHNSFFAVSKDKHQRLQQASSPKLVLIGDSNLTFGVDSSLFEKHLHVTPVNMAFTVGLGLNVIFNESFASLKPGDQVILSLTYPNFCQDLTNNEMELFIILGLNPKLLSTLGWPEYKNMMDKYFGFVHDMTRVAWNQMRGQKLDKRIGIQRDSFNMYGDVIHEDRVPNIIYREWMPDLPMNPQRFDFVVQQLNQFYADCQSKGVEVYFSYPPIEESYYQRNLAAIRAIQERLENHLEIPILGPQHELVMPRTAFFDTQYHLRFAHARQRTMCLIHQIKKMAHDHQMFQHRQEAISSSC